MKRERKIKRIGIFGGTFDPPHNAHLEIAEQAKKQLKLTRVFFIPAYIPPHKQNKLTSSVSNRLRMLKLLIGERKCFSISKIELRRKGISYTIDTLQSFHKQYKEAEFILIIGADNLYQFGKWRSPLKILSLATVAVYNRKGFNLNKDRNWIDSIQLKGKLIRISSTDIRDRIKNGLSIKPFVPLPIEKYIRKHSLYRQKNNKKAG